MRRGLYNPESWFQGELEAGYNDFVGTVEFNRSRLNTTDNFLLVTPFISAFILTCLTAIRYAIDDTSSAVAFFKASELFVSAVTLLIMGISGAFNLKARTKLGSLIATGISGRYISGLPGLDRPLTDGDRDAAENTFRAYTGLGRS